jgi:HTH-type transcriptional regulator/antitoxin HigA
MLPETYNEAVRHWTPVRDLLSVPKTDEQCDRMTDFLNRLLDQVGDDERHPLFHLIETLEILIETYETETIPEPETTPAQALRFLMEENRLTPEDLKELGSGQEISELLEGKAFESSQIRYLCDRFHLGPDIFSGTTKSESNVL